MFCFSVFVPFVVVSGIELRCEFRQLVFVLVHHFASQWILSATEFRVGFRKLKIASGPHSKLQNQGMQVDENSVKKAPKIDRILSMPWVNLQVPTDKAH